MLATNSGVKEYNVAYAKHARGPCLIKLNLLPAFFVFRMAKIAGLQATFHA